MASRYEPKLRKILKVITGLKRKEIGLDLTLSELMMSDAEAMDFYTAVELEFDADLDELTDRYPLLGTEEDSCTADYMHLTPRKIIDYLINKEPQKKPRLRQQLQQNLGYAQA